MRMTDGDADIVVAGAGHNSLLAACYLAKAGYRCLVLDARPVPGGGAATEELLLPGFGIDTCATGHTMIRVNPALLHDELGLAADYGLRYAEPDPVEQVAFPDGPQLTMWLDRDRTAAEVARFSAADAAAYLRLLDEYDQPATAICLLEPELLHAGGRGITAGSVLCDSLPPITSLPPALTNVSSRVPSAGSSASGLSTIRVSPGSS